MSKRRRDGATVVYVFRWMQELLGLEETPVRPPSSNISELIRQTSNIEELQGIFVQSLQAIVEAIGPVNLPLDEFD